MIDANSLAGGGHALALIGIKVGCDIAAVLGVRILASQDTGALAATLAAGASWAPALAICALYAVAMEPRLRPPWRSGRPIPVELMTIIGSLTIVVTVALAFLAGDATTPLEDSIRTNADLWALVIFAVVVTPVVEEWFFRGFLYQAVSLIFGEWGAVIIIGLLFGLFHAPQYASVPAALAAVTLMGLVITWMRKVGGGLIPCVVFHAVYNIVGVAILLASRS